MTSWAQYYGAVFPDVGEVNQGVQYGPTGADYTGTDTGGGGEVTISQASIADIVSQVQQVGDGIQSAVNLDRLTIDAGDYAQLTIAGVGSLAGRSGLVWILKSRETDSDSRAVLIVSEDNGLERLNGSADGLTAGDASITVTDAATGDLTITLKSQLTAELVPGLRFDGLKKLVAGGQDDTVRRGQTEIRPARSGQTTV